MQNEKFAIKRDLTSFAEKTSMQLFPIKVFY